jgi:glucose/mannose-6-phosphate isomerase
MCNRIYQSLNYRPPVSLTARTLFLAISYSGNSDSVVEQIRQLPEDVPSYIVTSGGELGRIAVERGTPTTWLPTGFSPRAAICHTLVAVLSIASSIGLGPDLRQELLEAVGVIDQLADEWGPSSPETSAAKVIARGLLGRIPVIHGSETTTAISRRWKTQLNETAGIPAFISDVIDSNQYEVEAWAHPSSAEKFAAIFLMDAGQSPGASRRLAVTRQQIEKLAVPVLELTAHGSNAVERILTQIMLADIVSVYVAVLRGKSPSETSAIDDFNGALFANSIRFSKSYGDEERKQ